MIDNLTPTERATALLVRDGLSAKEIAHAMGNTTQSVKNRLRRIYRKLGVESRTQLAVIVWEQTEGKQ